MAVALLSSSPAPLLSLSAPLPSRAGVNRVRISGSGPSNGTESSVNGGRGESRSARGRIPWRAMAAGEEASASVEEKESVKAVPAGGCSACGRESVQGGCDGEGRIQGGLAAISLFSWWPIKAYRPCPSLVQAGGKYRRAGQSLDEVAFGRKGRADDLDIGERFAGKKE